MELKEAKQVTDLQPQPMELNQHSLPLEESLMVIQPIVSKSEELFDIAMFEVEKETQLVNITKIAKVFGKNVNDWSKTAQTQGFLKEFKEKYPDTTEIVSKKGGSGEQGTWVHRKIAIKFAAWINPKFEIWCMDKLDELFQTGTTSLYNFPKTFGEALRLYADEVDRTERLTKELDEAKPKVEYYDQLIDATGSFDLQKAAAVLKIPNMGRNKLFAKLRDLAILQDNNVPYRRYINDEYFMVVETSYNHPKTGDRMISTQTRVTQKGLMFLQKKLK